MSVSITVRFSSDSEHLLEIRNRCKGIEMSSSKQAIHINSFNISNTETFVTCKRDQSSYRKQHHVSYNEKLRFVSPFNSQLIT